MTTLALPLDLTRVAVPRLYRRRRTPETPMFDDLAAEWAAFGRAVPGDRDREWVDLITRKIW